MLLILLTWRGFAEAMPTCLSAVSWSPVQIGPQVLFRVLPKQRQMSMIHRRQIHIELNRALTVTYPERQVLQWCFTWTTN